MINAVSLKFTRVSNAPQSPGLYAWYGKLDSPIADYKRQVDETGRDMGEVRFRRLLAKHLERYELAPFALTSKGTFGATWAGSMRDNSASIVQRAALGDKLGEEIDPYIRQFAESLTVVSEKEEYRHALIEVLERAYPAISAPIYIGVAENLRVRLGDHVSRYRQLRDAINGQEENFEKLRQHVDEKGGQFADRAILYGFQPDHLFVTILPLDEFIDENIPLKRKKQIAEVGEWLLNHWHRPYAGRR
jgi:hypothetical protein